MKILTKEQKTKIKIKKAIFGQTFSFLRKEAKIFKATVGLLYHVLSIRGKRFSGIIRSLLSCYIENDKNA